MSFLRVKITIMNDGRQKEKDKKKLSAWVNAILIECSATVGKITNLKLQKLLYLSYGEWSKSHEQELPYMEFKKWRFGPVSEPVYHYYKHLGDKPIPEIMEYNGRCFVEDEVEEIDFAMRKYSLLSVAELIDMTHRSGGAWEKASDDGILEYEDIKDEFRNSK